MYKRQDVTDRFGNRPVQISMGKDGFIKASSGSEMKSLMKFEVGKWYNFKIEANTANIGSYSLFVNDTKVLEKTPTIMAVESLERLSFRTGAFRALPNRDTPNEDFHPPLRGADEKLNLSSYLIDDVFISSIKK